jgi:hypothetical protein
MHDQTQEALRTPHESAGDVTWRLFQTYDRPGMTQLLRHTQERLSPNTPSYNAVTDSLAAAEQVAQMKQEGLAHHPDIYQPGIGYSQAHAAAMDAAIARGSEWIHQQSEHLNTLHHLDVHTQKWVIQGVREAFHQHPEIPLQTIVSFVHEVGDDLDTVDEAWQTRQIPRDQVLPLVIRPESIPLATSFLRHFHTQPNEVQELGQRVSFVQAFHLNMIGLTHNGGVFIDHAHTEYPDRSLEEIRRSAVELGLQARVQILSAVDSQHR